ncbi:MAG: type II secretion system F family protein [Haloechinothrix sp.]
MIGSLVGFAAALLVVPAAGSSEARLRALFASGVRSGRLHWASRFGARTAPSHRVRRPRLDAVGQLRLAASWDLFAAALRAGLPVPVAIRAVCDGLPVDAANALRATAELIALGADPDQAWQPALDCAQTSALARAARRTARSGTALASVSAELAVTVRAAVADAAESRAQRAAVLITAPLGLCFLPGFLCLGVVPVVLGLAGQLAV